MSDQVTALLLELYDTQRAMTYSNLAVGIVFGEWPPPHQVAHSR